MGLTVKTSLMNSCYNSNYKLAKGAKGAKEVWIVSDSGETVIYKAQGEVEKSSFVERVNPV